MFFNGNKPLKVSIFTRRFLLLSRIDKCKIIMPKNKLLIYIKKEFILNFLSCLTIFDNKANSRFKKLKDFIPIKDTL